MMFEDFALNSRQKSDSQARMRKLFGNNPEAALLHENPTIFQWKAALLVC